MVGISKDFFQGLVSGVFPLITYGFLLLGSLVQRPVLSIIHPQSIMYCLFFPCPSIFRLYGRALLLYYYFFDRGAVSTFFLSPPIPSELFTVYLSALLYLVYISFLSDIFCGYMRVLFFVFLSFTFTFAGWG